MRSLINIFFKLFLVVLICIHVQHVKAEIRLPVDSLKRALENQPEADTLRLLTLQALASNLRHSATSEALVYGHEALRIADSLGISATNRANILQILGLIYNTRADYQNSLFYSLQALRIYEVTGNSEGQAYAYNAMGVVYYSLKKYDRAKQYYLKTLKLFEKAGLHEKMSIIYNNLGNIMSIQKNYEKELWYYKKAVENTHKYNFPYTCRIYINIGQLLLEMGQPDSAKAYFLKVLDLSQHKEFDKAATALSYFGLGRTAFRMHNLNETEYYMLKAKEMIEYGGIKEVQMEMYKELAELYKEKKDLGKALFYYKQYDTIKDNIYNETTIRQITETQKMYEVEKRDKEIRLLSQQQQISEANARNQRLFRNFTIAGLLFMLIMIAVISRNIVLKQRVKNKILSEQHALAEKDIVKLNHENTLAKYEAMKSKTDPHFLFNSLTTLSSIVMEDPKMAVKYIKRFSALFRMVLEIGDHKLVTLQKEMEVVDNYLYLQKVRFGESLILHVDMPIITAQYFIPPFALQMVVENAIKHNIISNSFRFHLSVYVEEDVIVIKNNLQKKMSKVLSTSTGQKSVTERYRILCAEQPSFTETETAYTVKLPLLRKEDILIFKEELNV